MAADPPAASPGAPAGSLLARLVGLAVLWIAVALLAAGLMLAHLFRAHVERTFDARLRDHMAELVAVADTDAAGRLRLKRPSVDPNFARPLSGWYWQIADATGRIERSRSLWDQDLAVPAAGPSPRLVVLAGPQGQSLRALVRAVELPDTPAPFGFVVAGPQEGDRERRPGPGVGAGRGAGGAGAGAGRCGFLGPVSPGDTIAEPP